MTGCRHHRIYTVEWSMHCRKSINMKVFGDCIGYLNNDRRLTNILVVWKFLGDLQLCFFFFSIVFLFIAKGFVPGMFGVSHGALQFMTYEEMKNKYNIYRKMPINTKLVSKCTFFFHTDTTIEPLSYQYIVYKWRVCLF